MIFNEPCDTGRFQRTGYDPLCSWKPCIAYNLLASLPVPPTSPAILLRNAVTGASRHLHIPMHQHCIIQVLIFY